MNDIITKEISKNNPNLQTKLNANWKNEKEIMKANVNKLHVQRKFWKLHSKFLLQLLFFIMWMITKMLWCIVSCVIIVQSTHQIQEHKKKKGESHIINR
jgi:hypothetical protein